MAEQEKQKKLSELSQKDQTFALLKKEGMTNPQIAKVLNISPGHAKNISSKLTKYDLTDTKLVSVAHRSFKKLLRGQPVGDIEKVKDSTVLAATQMVFDRVQPVVRQSVNLNANLNFTEVDLEAFG